MPSNSVAASGGAIAPTLDSVLRKASWRIVPLFVACFGMAYLDRVNISFAKLQMQSELGLSDAAYGLGASIFFISYLVFEIPSNMILARVGSRLWIARIMISWGIASALMMFVKTEVWFYVLRFLLGMFEAGFVPGAVYYFTQWFPAKQRGRINSFFFTSIALCGILGGPISGAIMKYMDAVGGMHGWQWLFLLEGIPSVVLGFVVMAWLDDRVEDARWLNDDEKRILTASLEAEPRSGSTHSFSVALRQPSTYVFSVIYLGLAMGIYGILFWMPQLVKTAGTNDTFIIGLITMLPYLVALVGVTLIARSSDRTGERKWHLAGCALAGVVGYVMCGIFGNSTVMLVVGLSIAATGIIASFGLFWILPARVMTGVAAAGGLALINSVGQLGGVIGPYMVGVVRDTTGSADAALYAIAGVCALSAGLIVWCLPKRVYERASSDEAVTSSLAVDGVLVPPLVAGERN
ncbi:Putative metabolite transport protein NicT [Methylobacterium frigidaeris]|uniref:Metabolite transport protein NicT n=1 Tax=Methylobacterium frigidaeris TaxID=2038277 RepID=A0AA37HJV7_9HYPH|nr:Putative metabolite transport protein NicT [Methylobacterium frigidaeris]